jgi:hypothetical protein
MEKETESMVRKSILWASGVILSAVFGIQTVSASEGQCPKVASVVSKGKWVTPTDALPNDWQINTAFSDAGGIINDQYLGLFQVLAIVNDDKTITVTCEYLSTNPSGDDTFLVIQKKSLKAFPTAPIINTPDGVLEGDTLVPTGLGWRYIFTNTTGTFQKSNSIVCGNDNNDDNAQVTFPLAPSSCTWKFN